MGEKDQVVVEVIRDESPLAPAPPCETAAAVLDSILEVLKTKDEPIDSEAPGEAGGMLDLGFDDEETDADLNPMLNVESLRAGLASAAEPAGAHEDEEKTEAAGAPIPIREPEPEDTEAAGAPIPIRDPQPEEVVGDVAPVKPAGPAEYTGDGAIVEYESDAQRDAREEKELRHAAVLLAEEQEKAAILNKAEAEADAIAAKAEAESQAIKKARAEMDAKKQKREEARLARKDGGEDAGAGGGEDAGALGNAKNVTERVRSLNTAQQQKLARSGGQRERVTLERMYGKVVWESLLRNPKLTPPEAGRIARMGTLPIPLMEIIVANRAWLSAPQVRRALLSNPRLKTDMLMTVLRATPKVELKIMPKQMAYPAHVRHAAKKMMK